MLQFLAALLFPDAKASRDIARVIHALVERPMSEQHKPRRSRELRNDDGQRSHKSTIEHK